MPIKLDVAIKEAKKTIYSNKGYWESYIVSSASFKNSSPFLHHAIIFFARGDYCIASGGAYMIHRNALCLWQGAFSVIVGV